MSRSGMKRSSSYTKKPPTSFSQTLNANFHPVPESTYDRAINKSILSDKIPITFNPHGIEIKPMPALSLEHETKVTLYSEIERLTVLNYELKRQVDSLNKELGHQDITSNRVLELENHIRELERELQKRDDMLSENFRETERLKLDNMNLSKLEPEYTELLNHNRALISEIDRLNSVIKEGAYEKEKLKADIARIKVFETKFQEASRNVDALSNEIIEKNRESVAQQQKLEEIRVSYEQKINQLSTQLQEAYFENERAQNTSIEFGREIELVRSRYEEAEKFHQDQLNELREHYEHEKRIVAERERTELTSRFLIEKAKLESQLQVAYKDIEDLHNKLSLIALDNENLQQLNLEKVSEIDNMKLNVYQIENQISEVGQTKEYEKQTALDNQAREFSLQMMNQKKDYEEKIFALRTEITNLERLRNTIKEKEREIELLKNQHQINEKSWENKLQMAVDSENKQLTSKYTIERAIIEDNLTSSKNKIVELENQLSMTLMEIERLSSLVDEKTREVNELKYQLTSLQVSSRTEQEELKNRLELEKRRELEQLRLDLIKTYEAQLDAVKTKHSDLELRYVNVVNENSKLSHLAEDRLREIEIFKYKIQALEEKTTHQIHDLEKRHETTLKITVEKEVASSIAKHRAEVANLESKISGLDQQNEELESKAHYYETEIDRINDLLDQRNEELEEERRRYNALEAQRAQDITTLRQQFEAYKKANIDVSSLQVRFEAERSALNNQIYQQKEKTQELEERLALLVVENERLRNVYAERASEVEFMRRRVLEVEENAEKQRLDLEHQIEDLKQSTYDIQELTIRYGSDKAQYENQIRQLKILNENGKQELEKLYELMNQRKKEHEIYVKQNEELKKQIEKLSGQLRTADNESSAKKDKYEGLIRTLEEVEQERDIYRGQAERLNKELNRTSAELNDKIRELDLLKGKYEKAKELSDQLNSQLMNQLMKHQH